MDASRSGFYECNICLEQATEPVVTFCGHLYCWPCLYRWASSSSSSGGCPVCKAPLTSADGPPRSGGLAVIPLYGRGDTGTSAPSASTTPSGLPARPGARPLQPSAPGPERVPLGPGFTAGFGFFPSLFGLQFSTWTLTHTHTHGATPGGRQDDPHNLLLSRMLLALAIAVLAALLWL